MIYSFNQTETELQGRLLISPEILDSFSNGIIITDTRLHILQLNQWMRDHYKLPEQYQDLPIQQVFPELAERNLMEAYDLVINSSLPLTLSTRIHRYFLRTPIDGSADYMPQTTVISPLISADSRLLGTLTVITDVTERLSVEGQLHREVDKLNSLLDIDRSLATLDLEACLKGIIHHSRKIFRANEVTLYLIERGKLIKVQTDTQVEAKDIIGLPVWAAFHQEPVLVPDTLLDDRCESSEGLLRAEMTAPMMVDEMCIGVLDVQSETPGMFDAGDLSLLEALASRAAVAIYNARTHTEELRQRKMAEVLRDVSIALTSNLDQNLILETLLTHIRNVVPYDTASVILLEGDDLRLAHSSGFEDDQMKKIVQSIEESRRWKNVFTGIAQTRKPIIVPDVHTHPMFSLLKREDMHAWVGVPIITREKILGFLSISKKEVGFYKQEINDLLMVFSSYAAIALENAHLYEEQQKLAITDGLTGLANRRKFDETMAHEINRSSRYMHVTALIMIDVDDFKKYNDSYGHQAGDVVLRRIAELMRINIRGVDTAARYGGEEFCIILPETGGADAMVVAERIRKEVAHLHQSVTRLQEDVLLSPVSISLGVAVAKGNAIKPQQLIELADQALYHAKHTGKNRTILWNEQIGKE